MRHAKKTVRIFKRVLTVFTAGGSVGACLSLAASAVQLPKAGPVPQMRPPASQQPATAQTIKTAALPASLKSGLDALHKGDTAAAMTARNSLPPHTLTHKTLSWAIATSGAATVSSADIRTAMNELAGWSGKSLMQANFERALARETHTPQHIIAAFSQTRPQTIHGMVSLGAALARTGRTREARAVVAPWWHKAKLSAREEQRVLNAFGTILSKEDHLIRFKVMLYTYRLASAERLLPYVDAKSLYTGFAAVARNAPDAAQKLNAVDKSWRRDPVYLFARTQYLRRTGHYTQAAKLMLQAPKNTSSLLDSDSWWVERRALSRELLDIRNYKLAYKLAAISATESASAADAEFHAGWYALRFLNQPKIAFKHFSRIPQLSSNAISTARGFYWMGRAAQAGAAPDRATGYFHRAAHYGTTYYGQLAASKLGMPMPEVVYPRPNARERGQFAAREPVQAMTVLEAAGYHDEAARLYRTLAQELDNPGELALLTAIAEQRNDHYTSLRIGKAAASRGLDVGALSHPLGAIPETANISASGKALAYAIARQESEFNPKAVSGAGARGILQLMPATAKTVARRNGLPYSLERLSSDPAYNATLGAHFLGDQLKQFDGSYILTFIGYNAGPGRAQEWIGRYGDPRNTGLDEIVDWIERIPYTETRNYVQRVMENYQVYKARLTGKTDIAGDLATGRQAAAR
ncbi:MAG: Lytic transglycosylase [Candidatus Tokpelaia hoelldobleri]|uniref:Lytic transglycosylase n=1 Tax=Candidatus Tokpelaia hoelldobleri TaxID=1902579 RepID=A0A1U9JVR8_9HYPH|nr:MAG: Lytic transglycosylase [Candidatus Tokpelaia hoelldoblerii]